MLEKWFAPLALILVALMGAHQIGSIKEETQTWDEGIHLAAGLSYLRTHDYRMNPEHPALGKILCAMALGSYHLILPIGHPSWSARDETEFGNQFLYFNRVPADQILFAARRVTILLTLLFALSLAFWTRLRFGADVGLFALTLFAFDPNILAHGRYVTTDLICAMFVFLACILWGEFLMSRSTALLAASGVALGLAFVSKYSALYLLLVFPLLAAIQWIYHQRRGASQLIVSFAIALLLAIAVIGIAYGPETIAMVRGRMPLSALSYFTGVEMAARTATSGGSMYLLGHIYDQGRWWYFPLAFLVKTPGGVLALLLLALAIAIPAIARKPRAIPFRIIVLALPPVLFFALSMRATLNIGLRHILPVYPFLYVLIAYTVLRHGGSFVRRFAAPLLLLAVVAESAAAYPYYLSFFNVLSGGPDAGPKYLLDSNIDWGQDVKRLKRFMDANGLDHVCADIFGNAPPPYYGIKTVDLPADPNDLSGIQNMDCVIAASVTLVYDLHTVAPDHYKWLRAMPVTGKVGYSIYIYDHRKQPATPLRFR